MAGPGNRHCANCIGTLSFPIDCQHCRISGDFENETESVCQSWIKRCVWARLPVSGISTSGSAILAKKAGTTSF